MKKFGIVVFNALSSQSSVVKDDIYYLQYTFQEDVFFLSDNTEENEQRARQCLTRCDPRGRYERVCLSTPIHLSSVYSKNRQDIKINAHFGGQFRIRKMSCPTACRLIFSDRVLKMLSHIFLPSLSLVERETGTLSPGCSQNTTTDALLTAFHLAALGNEW